MQRRRNLRFIVSISDVICGQVVLMLLLFLRTRFQRFYECDHHNLDEEIQVGNGERKARAALAFALFRLP